ncbi:unnamed protein product [Chironomus riparius]|uniref:Peptidase S1 domain-containing protein n=1 Tax=Chironomus riparius TaxID=315576 RepID=A0A9N9WMV2_9DIPT|nr:unnamed protein product [Chironomus riparius]
MLKLFLISLLLLHVKCDFMGLFSSKKDADNSGNGRVVGGAKSENRVPYQISLQMQKKEGNSNPGFLGGMMQILGGGGGGGNFSHFCGGSVLNENHIVTAAHCIKGFNTSRMAVFAGTNDLREEDKGQRIMIDSCEIHPDYVELNTSDIAVCRLKESFSMGDNITPIEMGTEHIEGGEECLLTGWGYTSRMVIGRRIPNELQEAKFYTITNEECNQMYSTTPTELCTKSKGLEGACNGDSGGPLVCKNKLAGVVSYGLMICGTNQPDVYTRVSEFTDWVQQMSSM